MSRFVVGIDLGTTNSALAFVDTATEGAAIQSFPIRSPGRLIKGSPSNLVVRARRFPQVDVELLRQRPAAGCGASPRRNFIMGLDSQ